MEYANSLLKSEAALAWIEGPLEGHDVVVREWFGRTGAGKQVTAEERARRPFEQHAGVPRLGNVGRVEPLHFEPSEVEDLLVGQGPR